MKKVFAIAVCVIVLIFALMPAAFALTQYRVYMYDVSGDDFVGVSFKSDTDQSWSSNFITYETWTGNYDFTLQCKVTLLDPIRYSGCFISVSTSEGGQNIVSQLVTIEPDPWGNYYVPSGVPFNINLTVYPPTTYYFSCIRVNYADYVSAQGGYLAGYRDGKSDGYMDCYNNKYLPTLEELNSLKELWQDFDLDAYTARVADQARSDAIRDSDMVPNIFTSIFNAIGRLFGQFLTLDIFGIKVWAIFLVLALVPIGLWIASKFITHGG